MGWRWACAAGTFYPADPPRLTAEIEACFQGPREALGPPGEGLTGPVGLILPHAGYRYSGAVAATGFSALWRLGRPEAVVILGTNHTGLGGAIAVGGPGTWETPLGTVPVEEELAGAIADGTGADRTDLPFHDEHSVEVQLPFLQHLFGAVPLVPVVVQHLDLAQARAAGTELAQVLAGRPVALIASTDFTHYEPDEVARKKDRRALTHILNLDLPGFLDEVARQHITICGVGAIALLLAACRELGLLGTKLLAYRTSGEVAGHLDQVVGYAAVLFQRVDDVA
ncbi:AmmeMemoRadiSam system protein B [Candidatus Bipolaricaulota bacterium]|nr:AmmeMemoRadiSam system protein B [Candidatus Bipolaricaulota bacterium]